VRWFGCYVIACDKHEAFAQEALATKQSSLSASPWIASRSLPSGAHSRDPVARNDGVDGPRRHQCARLVLLIRPDKGAVMNEISTIGLDLAKNVFQLHGVDGSGEVVLRRQLRRGAVERFLRNCRRACGDGGLR